MTTQRHPLRWTFRLLAAVFAAVALTVPFAPMAPVAHADPQGDAVVAIDQAWVAAGGDTSPLGPKVGGIYPAGTGFGQDFVHGAMFFSPDTGARSMYGAILEKYRALGGPVDSGLGFPNIDEGPGRAADSRNVTFSAGDGAVIFWTPATGAWLVRGIINSAWDRVGGSSGPLGVPVEDETYSGETISQRFSGGQLTYDTAAKTFTTTPPELAGQLADLPLPDDAASAIDLAWRVAGGAEGQLGAKDGQPYPVGDGTGQNFAGGKIYFSPETGAHVVSGTILEKYEAAGGPTGELGFPTSNEVDGDVPGSRISTFGTADPAVIVWTPEHGAVIVRGPMKAAWDELGGSGGDLGVPIADQTGEDTITQNFSGGQVTYNSSNNSFSTQPPELAQRLSGLDLPQQATPAAPAPAAPPAAADGDTDTAGGSAWSSWYLWAIIALAVLALAGLAGFLVMRQRRAGQHGPVGGGPYDSFRDDGRHEYDAPGRDAPDHDAAGYDAAGYDAAGYDPASYDPASYDDDKRAGWVSAGGGQTSGPTRFGDADADDTEYLAAQQPWASRDTGHQPWSDPAVPTGGAAVTAVGADLFTHQSAHQADDYTTDIDDPDQDAVDTAPTPVHIESDEPSGRHAAVGAEESRPPWLTDDSYVPGPNSLFAPVYGAAPPPAQADAAESVAAPSDDEVYPRSEYAEPVSAPDGYDHPVADYARPDYSKQSGYQGGDYEGGDYEAQPGIEPAAYAEPDEDVSTSSAVPPAIHLPLEDPDEAPEGYPIKGSMRTGTYHSPGSESFDVTVAEIWFASEELAESNGFTRAE